MISILFAIVFLWLFVLTIHHYQVFRDFEAHRHEKVKETIAGPPAGEMNQNS